MPSYPSRTSAPSSILPWYLTIYNACMLVAWAWMFLSICVHAIGLPLLDKLRHAQGGWLALLSGTTHWRKALDPFSESFDRVGRPLGYVQAAAAIEILHALFRMTNSSVLINVIQIGARNLLIWVYLLAFGTSEMRHHFAFSSMALAWALADGLRYAFYLFPKNRPLRWARYSMFYLLYPIGAASEFYIVVLAIESRKCPWYMTLLAHLHLLLFFPGIPSTHIPRMSLSYHSLRILQKLHVHDLPT
jgi:very-long-chain (3R)-3-hydroxyacyl-CoA dehydratase